MRIAPLAVLAPTAALAVAQTAPALSGTGLGRRLFPVVTRVAAARSVALTFDDGPDASLELFLKALDRAGARATFFLVGEQVARFPHAPATIVAAGHELAVHGYTHRGHLRRTPWALAEDLRRARAIIEDAAGRETKLHRPPYGVYSYGSWREAGRQGLVRTLWSRWGKDWEESATPSGIADCIGQPQPGDVLLLHDSDRYSAPGSWQNTLGALPIVLERIMTAGLAACSVTEVLTEAADAPAAARVN